MKIFGICICILLPIAYFIFAIYKFKIYKEELDKIKEYKNTKEHILLYIFDRNIFLKNLNIVLILIYQVIFLLDVITHVQNVLIICQMKKIIIAKNVLLIITN